MEYQQGPETGAAGLAFAGFGEAVFPYPVLEEVPHSNSVLVLVSFSFLTTYAYCADILVEQCKLWPLPASPAPTWHAAVPGQAVSSSACGLCSSGGENMGLGLQLLQRDGAVSGRAVQVSAYPLCSAMC